MARGKITKRAVDAMVAEKRDAFLWDEDLKGFGVKVTPHGVKSYIYQYRLGGREARTRRFTVGKHGSPWTPSTARGEVERLAVAVAQGKDPVAAELERRRLAVDLAFDSYAIRFISACGDRGWGRMVERTVRLHLAPNLARKPIDQISRADISAILDHISPSQIALKRNTFAVLRGFFRWAVNRGDIERSPCEGMDTPAPVPARDRVLSEEELARVWKAADTYGALFGPIVQLLIATGQRREEVSALPWSEIDQKSMIWTLPKERSKNDTAHLIPLNEPAALILRKAAGAEKWPREGIVFATKGNRCFTAHSKGKAKIDAIISNDGSPPMSAWRLHDLRRTVATGLQKLGTRFEVTEAVLNHVSRKQSGVAATYQRHDWAPEKREALNDWGVRLSKIVGLSPSDQVSREAECFTEGLMLGLEIGKSLR